MSDKSVGSQMSKILDEVMQSSNESIEKAINRVPRRVAKHLRETSPKRKAGKYAAGWTFKKLDERHAVVYNKAIPGYTMLLEHGHDIVNQYGSSGRAKAIPHIAPAEEMGVELFYETIKTELQK